MVVCRSAFGWSALPCPGEGAGLGRRAGASFVSLRSSRRSLSGWVVVLWFSGRAEAVGFGRAVAPLSPRRFVALRCCGGWWCVSVPVAVFLSSSPVDSCPVWFVRC